MRALVVGAGPAGLTAAVEMARRGLTPEVVDKAPGPSPLSRAVGVLPESLRLLAPSGVAARLVEEGVRVATARFHVGARPVFDLPLASGDEDYPYLLALPQDRTEAALAHVFAACGGEVAYGVEIAGVAPEKGGAVARRADGSEARYDLVVAADGAHSAVRESLGLSFEGHDLPEPWSIADVEAADWPCPETFVVCLLARGGVVIVAPLGGGRYRLVANRPDALAALPLAMTPERVRRADSFRIAVRQAEAYAAGAVHLAGDAAHCHSPVGGRGMNVGIADGADLARRAVEGGLEGYAPARRAVGARVIRRTEAARRIIGHPSPAARLALRAALALLDRAAPLKRRIARAVLTG